MATNSASSDKENITPNNPLPSYPKVINENGGYNLNLIRNLWESSYNQAMYDIQSMINLSTMVRFQQPMAYQILSILGYCSCNYSDMPSINNLYNTDSGRSNEEPTGAAFYQSRFTFPTFTHQPDTHISNGRKEEGEKDLKTDITQEKQLLEESGREGFSHSVGDAPDSEEEKDDNYLLETHPYEIKYILNKKTNRKLKRMICKVPGCDKNFSK